MRHNDPSPPPKPKQVSFPICEDDAGFSGWLKRQKSDAGLPETLSDLLLGTHQLVWRTLQQLPHRYRDSR